ncbi:MAG: hypothetical protein AB1679_36560 [Actinomycetota bacterium]
MSGVIRRSAVAVVLSVAVIVPPAAAPAGADPLSLAGGGATGRGIFLTYSDRDTVLEGGTVAAPDLASPVAQAAIDFTGLGSALAALGYSPYSDAAGVLNAFGGTELPVGSIGERSRAKVAGRPPQESTAALSESVGQAQARLVDGPAAEAWTSVVSAPDGAVTARTGELRATVATVTKTADSRVTVVLRQIRIGELRIESIVLTAEALADGAAGRATASTVVEGATLGGRPVRLTPRGLEPVGATAPDLSGLDRAGIEVVSTGGALARPGGRQADARAIGPRLRLRSPDGRLLTVVLGEAVATSTREPGQR